MAGSLKQRGPGRWQLVAYVGKDDAGRKQYRWKTVLAGDKWEAERLLAAFVTDVQRGVAVKPQKDTLADYLRQWLSDVRDGLAPNTLRGYTVNVENHILPVLGAVKLQNLRPADVQRLLRVLAAKNLSPRSCQYVFAVLRRALSDAWRVGLISENPVGKVRGPKVVRQPLDLPPTERIIAALDTLRGKPLYGIALVALTTGLRRSEVLALRWTDADLDAATVRVSHSLGTTRAGVPTFAPTKSPTSRRQVFLPPVTVAYLREVRDGQASLRAFLGGQYRDYGLVFCHDDGRAPLASTVSQTWCAAMRKAGLPGLRFHDLRHAYAVVMLRANVNPKVLQQALGHSAIGVTLDIYGAHLIPGAGEKAALEVQKALQPREDRQNG